MSKAKVEELSPRQRFQNLSDKYEEKVGDVFRQLESRTVAAEHERDSAIASLALSATGPPPALEGKTPITRDALLDIGLKWSEERGMCWCDIGRLSVAIKDDGEWTMSNSSTYGGSVYSYRKLQSMEEVRMLIYLTGCLLPAWSSDGKPLESPGGAV